MIEIKDRIPTKPNRIKLVSEDDGTSKYYTLSRADEPIVDGTPINKALFDSVQEDFDNLQTSIDQINTDVANLQNNMATHTHDDRYYTESEIDTKVNELNTAIANSGKFYGIDTTNIIALVSGSPARYTATEDCYCFISSNDPIKNITLDGVGVTEYNEIDALGTNVYFLVVKKGQDVVADPNGDGRYTCWIKVLGLKS